MQVIGTYASGPEINVTTTGTSYSISNAAVATITAGGLVTAVGSGTAIIQASNEGATGILLLRVLLSGVDTDGDGIPDEEEVRLGLNPANAADALLDLDHDGLNALDEYRAGTDLRNPDSDGDGLSDGDEVRCLRSSFCTNPLLADTDGDGIRDATEIQTGSDPTNATSYNFADAISALRVSPASFTLIVNSLTGSASVQLTVTGTVIDGTEIDLTSTTRQTIYSSSNLASCNFGSPDGRVFASAAGGCEITIGNNGHTAVASGTVRDFAPTQLSFVAIPGYANGVAVSGDYAFVASGATGLQVVSLSSDRRTPTIVATLDVTGASYDITVAGTTAYLATSNGLKVVDVSTPTSPRLLGTFAGVGSALGVKVRGTTAYVAAGSSLFIVSVANPDAMILAGSINLGGTAWNLDLDTTSNLAAVAAGGAGLKLVDISTLSAPVLRGTSFTGDARGVALRGSTAIVADYANSMTSVNIANLATPVILSRTLSSLGGLLTNVVLSGSFALGSDVVFVNGVPIVDITDPATLRPRSILNFTARDDNGMGIAVDDSFVYVVTDHSGLSRGGAFGDGRLYIGQYQPREDLAGVPPTVTITSPLNGAQVYEGAPLTVTVDAVDDIAVASVQFLIGGSTAFTGTTAPYQYTFTVPTGVGSIGLGATARDLGGNERQALGITVSVAPDPLTRVIGLVVDGQGAPLSGGIVTAPGGRTGTTAADGRFQIDNVPTVLGNIVVQVQYTAADGSLRTGSSMTTVPVLAGTTDVGTVTVVEVQFETNYGTYFTNADDTFVQRTLPFVFPYYGQDQTIGYVGTNGYITFGSGDNTFTENVASFSSLQRISAFFDDLFGARSVTGNGAVYINDALQDRFVVTYDRVGHFSFGGSNTIQIQLFRDGRIVFAFRGISALTTGSITGLSAGPGTPFLQVNYNETPTFDVAAGTSVYEYFTGTNPFDIDNTFIEFTPTGGGYRVRTILAPTVAGASTLAGALSKKAPGAASVAVRSLGSSGRAPRPLTVADIANAEVIVRSSGNTRWTGMTNTDSRGRFSLSGVPAGGVSVVVQRNGIPIARGAASFAGGNLNQAQLLNLDLVSAEVQPKAN